MKIFTHRYISIVLLSTLALNFRVASADDLQNSPYVGVDSSGQPCSLEFSDTSSKNHRVKILDEECKEPHRETQKEIWSNALTQDSTLVIPVRTPKTRTWDYACRRDYGDFFHQYRLEGILQSPTQSSFLAIKLNKDFEPLSYSFSEFTFVKTSVGNVEKTEMKVLKQNTCIFTTVSIP